MIENLHKVEDALELVKHTMEDDKKYREHRKEKREARIAEAKQGESIPKATPRPYQDLAKKVNTGYATAMGTLKKNKVPLSFVTSKLGADDDETKALLGLVDQDDHSWARGVVAKRKDVIGMGSCERV